jgi:hypothetical protein
VKGMLADTFGSRWNWEEQPSGLDMEIRCRKAGRSLPSEGVSAMTSAIVDKSGRKTLVGDTMPIGTDVFIWGEKYAHSLTKGLEPSYQSLIEIR